MGGASLACVASLPAFAQEQPAPAPAVAAAPAPTPAPAPAPAVTGNTASSAAAAAEREVSAAVHAWAKAWESQDMNAYLGAYDKNYTPNGKQSHAAWEKERRDRIVGRAKINVSVNDLRISVNGNKAQARFRQGYSSGSYSVNSRKTLDLVNTGGQWTIVREATGG